MKALVVIWRGVGSLIGLGLFAYMIVQLVAWLSDLFEAYKPAVGTSAHAPAPSTGVFLDGVLWVLPFSMHTIVLTFTSWLGEGAYWVNLARGLRISSFAYMSQVIVLFGLIGVDFTLIHKVPAVLLGCAVCAVAHWLSGRVRVDDESTKIVHAASWVVILWSLTGYVAALATSA